MTEARAEEASTENVSLKEAFYVWLKIGVLSFGGPAAQIALMHKLVVEEKRWLSEKQYLSGLSFCMLLPGPEAMQLASYAGWRLHGILGGLIAGLLFVIPGALVVMVLASLYAFYGDIGWLEGVFLGIKHGARAMQRTGRGGSIINTASIAALSGKGGPLAYSATKAAVVNITMNAAVELAESNIRVNAVCPGIIFTELMHRGRAQEAEQVIEKIQPSTLRGEPEHIASMVRFLASDDSAFVTGTTQLVDGGYLANGLLGVNPLPGVSNKPKYTGMNHGTTGQGTEVRFLESNTRKNYE